MNINGSCGNENMRKEFLDALQRLLDGKPRNSQLSAKILAGKPIKINSSTVAKEANRNRINLLRNYPDVVDIIKNTQVTEKIKSGNRYGKSAQQQTIDGLRKENELLRLEKRNIATENMALLVRMERCEERCKSAELSRDNSRANLNALRKKVASVSAI